MDLAEIVVRPLRSGDEPRYQELMRRHHDLGALPKIRETLWSVATWREEGVALRSFSASALKGAARERFGCRREKGRYVVPRESIIRNVLIRVEPAHLDPALRRWKEACAGQEESLAIDGKTLCKALDAEGRQTQVRSVVGHQTQPCDTPTKSVPCP